MNKNNILLSNKKFKKICQTLFFVSFSCTCFAQEIDTNTVCPQTTVNWGDETHHCSGLIQAQKIASQIVVQDADNKGKAIYKCNPATLQFEKVNKETNCGFAFTCSNTSIEWRGKNGLCKANSKELLPNETAIIYSSNENNGSVKISCQKQNDQFNYVLSEALCN